MYGVLCPLLVCVKADGYGVPTHSSEGSGTTGLHNLLGRREGVQVPGPHPVLGGGWVGLLAIYVKVDWYGVLALPCLFSVVEADGYRSPPHPVLRGGGVRGFCPLLGRLFRAKMILIAIRGTS